MHPGRRIGCRGILAGARAGVRHREAGDLATRDWMKDVEKFGVFDFAGTVVVQPQPAPVPARHVSRYCAGVSCSFL